jgi:DNA-binding GntR family transcriptional regulator
MCDDENGRIGALTPEEVRDACLIILDLSNQAIRLLAGELTAQEMRTVQAILKNRMNAIRNINI